MCHNIWREPRAITAKINSAVLLWCSETVHTAGSLFNSLPFQAKLIHSTHRTVDELSLERETVQIAGCGGVHCG